jgi:hypothetical protein
MEPPPRLDQLGLVARLRGAPDLGAYGFVQPYQGGSSTLACQANAAFDGDLYRLQFPSACLGSPVRITAAIGLYDDSGQDLLGGDYAPGHGGEAMSDWLNMRYWLLPANFPAISNATVTGQQRTLRVRFQPIIAGPKQSNQPRPVDLGVCVGLAGLEPATERL